MLSPTTHPTSRIGRRRKTLLLAAGLAGVAVTAAACGSSATAASSYGGRAGKAPAPPANASVISTRSSSLGTLLAAGSGRTVYLFEKDKGTTSSCAGACASLWPPVTTTGTPSATGTAHGNMLGTTRRSDGSIQVTYAGHPLYYFAGDHAAGNTTGQGLKDFGAAWYVLSPNGHKIDSD